MWNLTLNHIIMNANHDIISNNRLWIWDSQSCWTGGNTVVVKLVYPNKSSDYLMAQLIIPFIESVKGSVHDLLFILIAASFTCSIEFLFYYSMIQLFSFWSEICRYQMNSYEISFMILNSFTILGLCGLNERFTHAYTQLGHNY